MFGSYARTIILYSARNNFLLDCDIIRNEVVLQVMPEKRYRQKKRYKRTNFDMIKDKLVLQVMREERYRGKKRYRRTNFGGMGGRDGQHDRLAHGWLLERNLRGSYRDRGSGSHNIRLLWGCGSPSRSEAQVTFVHGRFFCRSLL